MELVSLLVSVVIVGFLVWLVLWGLSQIGLPEPFAKIARVLVIVIAIIWLVNKFLPFLN